MTIIRYCHYLDLSILPPYSPVIFISMNPAVSLEPHQQIKLPLHVKYHIGINLLLLGIPSRFVPLHIPYEYPFGPEPNILIPELFIDHSDLLLRRFETDGQRPLTALVEGYRFTPDLTDRVELVIYHLQVLGRDLGRGLLRGLGPLWQALQVRQILLTQLLLLGVRTGDWHTLNDLPH